jgi:hypothetical protein
MQQGADPALMARHYVDLFGSHGHDAPLVGH